MDAAQKSFQLQAQVRQNAEIVKNTLNDLYSWEKEIKDMEKKIHTQPDNNMEKKAFTLPVRSEIKKQEAANMSTKLVHTTNPLSPLMNGTKKYDHLLSPSSEVQDSQNDLVDMKHKEANEIKDRGNKYVKLAEYAKAIEAYTQALQLYADDAVYYSNRALCYLKLERYDECIADCEIAISIDSLAVKAYYRRMLANESLGNNMDALKDCTTVLTIEPKNGEAKRSLERINERLRKNAQNIEGPNFSPLRSNLVDILPIDKPAYKRSTKPLSRIAVTDVVGPKESKNYENLTISDEDIDKLFNSNCGQFEEVKGDINKENSLKTATNIPKETKATNEGDESEKSAILHKKKYATTNNIEWEDAKERPLPPAPTSTAQFYSNWRGLTARQKYQYLKSIPVNKICKILGAGFDSETLSDIISTLHDFYLLENDANAAHTLLEVSKNKQVSILSLLISKEEQNVLAEIINSLKNNHSLDAGLAEEIRKNFNLN